MEGFTTGTLDVYDELIAADFIDHDPQNPFAATLHGPQLMRSAVVLYRRAFPDLVLTVEEQYEDGDVVITRFEATGTQTGGLPGLPPAGRQMTVGGVQIDRFDGDKIGEGWRHWDTLGMLQQLGAVPTPRTAPTAYRPRHRANARSYAGHPGREETPALSRLHHPRHHARVPLTGVTVAIAQAPDTSPRVLNISRGGLLLDGLQLEPGVTVDFTLKSRDLHGVGSGYVVHLRHGLTGIAVRRWDDGLDAAVDDLIQRALLAESTWRELYDGLPCADRIEPYVREV